MSSAWVAECSSKCLVGMGERVVRDERGDVRELGLLGLEELAARRGVEEEVADGDGGAGGQAGLFDAEDVAAGDLDQGAGSHLRRRGSRASRRETLAMEGRASPRKPRVAMESRSSEVRSLEVAWRSKASRASSLDHAVAVVGDADELAAAGFDLDADAGGAGVEGVFEQLFDDGGGALDDFAGGDLVGYLVGEDADTAHRMRLYGSGA